VRNSPIPFDFLDRSASNGDWVERSGPEGPLEVLEVGLPVLFDASHGYPVNPGGLAAGISSDVALGRGQPLPVIEHTVQVLEPMARVLGCSLTYLPLQCTDVHRYVPPCWHAVSLREQTLPAPVLRPCTELSSAPWMGRDPHRLLRPDAPLHAHGFAPYSALRPQSHAFGRFPFRALFTFGPLGVHFEVSPKTTIAPIIIPWRGSRVRYCRLYNMVEVGVTQCPMPLTAVPSLATG
jgi:hypothetical protein